MDAKLDILSFLHKTPRYVLLMTSLFANKHIVELYGKRCISVHSPSPPKKVYRQMHSNFSYFSVVFHIIVLQELYLLGCCKSLWSSGDSEEQKEITRCLR